MPELSRRIQIQVRTAAASGSTPAQFDIYNVWARKIPAQSVDNVRVKNAAVIDRRVVQTFRCRLIRDVLQASWQAVNVLADNWVWTIEGVFETADLGPEEGRGRYMDLQCERLYQGSPVSG